MICFQCDDGTCEQDKMTTSIHVHSIYLEWHHCIMTQRWETEKYTCKSTEKKSSIQLRLNLRPSNNMINISLCIKWKLIYFAFKLYIVLFISYPNTLLLHRVWLPNVQFVFSHRTDSWQLVIWGLWYVFSRGYRAWYQCLFCLKHWPTAVIKLLTTIFPL